MSDRAPDVIARLEKAIERLGDGAAPVEELVAAHQEALKLLDEAEADLARLKARAAEVTEALRP
ncbi:MAG TPA: exodeoxyribonuclease VII small subunit [Candidatus Dormibacteraeota bacterium]|nr:exodeoxyribonuclease VII small subunit [Candidatus Dormibacteraeota bacterium]